MRGRNGVRVHGLGGYSCAPSSAGRQRYPPDTDTNLAALLPVGPRNRRLCAGEIGGKLKERCWVECQKNKLWKRRGILVLRDGGRSYVAHLDAY